MPAANKKQQRLFVHLRVHSAYSLLEGALPISRLAELAAAERMPALALTDTNNLFGVLEFSETMAEAGIQPIIGCTLTVEFPDGVAAERRDEPDPARTRPSKQHSGRLALLAKDETGYANLLKLASKSFLDSAGAAEPFVGLDDLAEHQEGLIALTGGPDGPVDRAFATGNDRIAADRFETLRAMFGDRLYAEVQRHGLAEERAVEPKLLSLAYGLETPLVATNQAYFPSADHFEAHDALICIAEGNYIAEDNRRQLSPEHYFKTAEEMAEVFADLPEALDNTVEIARRCHFRPIMREPILPQSVTSSEDDPQTVLEHEAQELRRQAEEGLRTRLSHEGTSPGAEEKDYWERLERELEIIAGMTYAGYFLIVADFIQWARQRGIPVGPGRGSGAGSVVAWALTITDLDPIRFGLLFERFLNPARVSMPDFDIDFCQERRDEVIAYVQEKYGHERVAHIITFGKLQARAVLRDVGRVLQMPYGQVDRLCKLVPHDPANPVTLAEAIAGEPKLREARDREEIVARLLDIGQRLEGLYRHASTHAAGIVIGDRPLTELVPLYRDPRSSLPATQFNMKWVEAAGLVKFDFLGLKTLSVIETAKQMIAQKGVEIDPARLPFDDEKTFELLEHAETVGVFQLESSGMRDSLRKLRPDRFEDIIAMVALFRPGPMANIETYINRKHGLEEPDYPHPLIQPILEETYGVIIYQEQVMQIAQVLSGYSLGEADLLRRAMGKKIKKEMDEQRSRFVEGAVENGVERSRAEYIFELVAKFAGYGFNKSHAAAYALLAYQTAYLKANHPVEFLAASMTFDMGNTDKLNIFAQEARRCGIAVEPPSVNASRTDFAPGDGAVRYALGALKNMGRSAAQALVAEREHDGPYADLADFAARLDGGTLNKRGLESLIMAGALDDFDGNRARLFANTDRILRAAGANGDDSQDDLFGADAVRGLALREAEPWRPIDQLSRELDAIGFYLSGHPLDEYDAVLQREGVESWAEFGARAQRGSAVAGKLAGTVTYLQSRTSAKGNRFGFVGLSDRTGHYEAIIFSELLAAHGETLVAGTPVLVELEAEADGEGLRARLKSVEPLDATANRIQSGVRVVVEDASTLDALWARMPPEGDGEIRLVLRLADVGREIELAMPGRYEVTPQQTGALGIVDGVAAVEPILSGGRPAS